MRNSENIRLARELMRVANELEAASDFDTTKYFQKAVEKPTSQNVKKFTKSIKSSPRDDDDMAMVAEALMGIAKQLIGDNDEESL